MGNWGQKACRDKIFIWGRFNLSYLWHHMLWKIPFETHYNKGSDMELDEGALQMLLVSHQILMHTQYALWSIRLVQTSFLYSVWSMEPSKCTQHSFVSIDVDRRVNSQVTCWVQRLPPCTILYTMPDSTCFMLVGMRSGRPSGFYIKNYIKPRVRCMTMQTENTTVKMNCLASFHKLSHLYLGYLVVFKMVTFTYFLILYSYR